MTELREQIARAVANSPLSENPEYALADAVMAVVAPIEAERDELRLEDAANEASLDHVRVTLVEELDLASDVPLPEALSAVAVRLDQLLADRAGWDQRLSDVQAEYLKREASWDRTRERLTRQRAELLRLHAEAVWQRDNFRRDAEIFEGLHKANTQRYSRRIMEFGRRCGARLSAERESRIRWAEKAARLETAHSALLAEFFERGEAIARQHGELAALRASAVVLPEPVQRLVDWYLVAPGTNISPVPTQREMRAALEAWRPATVEAPSEPAERLARADDAPISVGCTNRGEVVGAIDVLTLEMQRHLIELLPAPYWHPETPGEWSVARALNRRGYLNHNPNRGQQPYSLSDKGREAARLLATGVGPDHSYPRACGCPYDDATDCPLFTPASGTAAEAHGG